jgi:hypothetical protein
VSKSRVHIALGAAVAEHCCPLLLAVLAEHPADPCLTAQRATKDLYGADGKVEGLCKRRLRHPQQSPCSIGRPKLRRRKRADRADLDRFLMSNPRFRRHPDGRDFAYQLDGSLCAAVRAYDV